MSAIGGSGAAPINETFHAASPSEVHALKHAAEDGEISDEEAASLGLSDYQRSETEAASSHGASRGFERLPTYDAIRILASPAPITSAWDQLRVDWLSNTFPVTESFEALTASLSELAKASAPKGDAAP